ncbi:phage gp6-like head-tail connector protein [Sinorhizobium medicae]|nr:phage gp6-like head-tail connector protein [Sinorhizobium medicae]MDX1022738.1 phage gp6-like head-tail connector protein [Sinorhizobium medicae]
MSLRLVTPATAEIVTLAEAKAHLRVDFTDDDAYITALAEAAQDWLSGENNWLGRSVVEQTWELKLERFPSGKVDLPKPPLIEVTGVFYTPSDGGAEVEIADFREIDVGVSEGGYILPAKNTDWPVTDGEPGSVRITFESGYSDVPKSIKHAALLMIGHWYENREAASQAKISDLPMAVDALLYPYRNWRA